MENNIYHILFPYLKLSFNLSPVAFEIGSISIKWYGIIIAVGFLVAYFYMNFRKTDFGFSGDDIADFVLVPSALAIIFARIYYIIFYPGDFYLKNPTEIIKISHGGIAIYGAIIGGFIGLLIISKIKNKDFLNALDIMSLGLLVGQSIGRWGNFVNQEAFGSSTNSIFAMISENTHGECVHPCFLYESFGCLLGFVVLHIITIHKRFSPGFVFIRYLLIYGTLRLVIEHFRTDSLMIPNTSVKISSIVSLILVVISIFVILINKKSRKNFTI